MNEPTWKVKSLRRKIVDQHFDRRKKAEDSALHILRQRHPTEYREIVEQLMKPVAKP